MFLRKYLINLVLGVFDMLLISKLQILSGILAAFLALFVFIQRPRAELNQVYLCLGAIFAFWLISGGFREHYISTQGQLALFNPNYLFHRKWGLVSGCFLGVIHFWFVVIFPKKSTPRLSIVAVFLFAISCFFAILTITDRMLIKEALLTPTYWYKVFSVIAISYLILTLFVYLYKIRRETNIRDKQILKWVFVGQSITWISVILLGLIPSSFNITSLTGFPKIIAVFSTITIAFAVIKYQAFDIKTAIHQTIAWILTTSVSIFLLYFSLSNAYLLFYRASYSWSFSKASIGTLLLILSVLYLIFVQSRINRLFFRGKSLASNEMQGSIAANHLNEITEVEALTRSHLIKELYSETVRFK